MIVISKSILGLSALLAGAVVGADIVHPPLAAAPGGKIEARHPAFGHVAAESPHRAGTGARTEFAEARLVPAGAGTGKGDRLAKGSRPVPDCAARAWPYAGADCAPGEKARGVDQGADRPRSVRVIPLDGRGGEGASGLLRIPSGKSENN